LPENVEIADKNHKVLEPKKDLLTRLDNCLFAATSKSAQEWSTKANMGPNYDYNSNFTLFSGQLPEAIKICITHDLWDDLLQRFEDNTKITKYCNPLMDEILKNEYTVAEPTLIKNFTQCPSETQKKIANILTTFHSEQGIKFLIDTANIKNKNKAKYVEIAKAALAIIKNDLPESKFIKAIIDEDDEQAKKLEDKLNQSLLAENIVDIKQHDELGRLLINLKNKHHALSEVIISELQQKAILSSNIMLAITLLTIWGINKLGDSKGLIKLIFEQEDSFEKLKQFGSTKEVEILRAGLKDNKFKIKILKRLAGERKNLDKSLFEEIKKYTHSQNFEEQFYASMILSSKNKDVVTNIEKTLYSIEYEQFWLTACKEVSQTKSDLLVMNFFNYPDRVKELITDFWISNNKENLLNRIVWKVINQYDSDMESERVLWVLDFLIKYGTDLVPLKKLIYSAEVYLQNISNQLASPAGMDKNSIEDILRSFNCVLDKWERLNIFKEIVAFEKLETYPPLVLHAVLNKLLYEQEISEQVSYLNRLLKTALIWNKHSLHKGIEDFALSISSESDEFAYHFLNAIDDEQIKDSFIKRIIMLLIEKKHSEKQLFGKLEQLRYETIREFGKVIGKPLEDVEIFLQGECQENERGYKRKVTSYFDNLRNALVEAGLEKVEQDYAEVKFNTKRHQLIQQLAKEPESVHIVALGITTKHAGIIRPAAVVVKETKRGDV